MRDLNAYYSPYIQIPERLAHYMIALVVLLILPLSAQEIYSFEDGIPAHFKTEGGMTLKRCNKEQVHGGYSLKISWEKQGGSLTVPTTIDATQRILNQRKHTSVFHVWIFNPGPQKNTKIRFNFGTNATDRPEAWFDYHLNFTGWRTVMIPFNRMAGNPSQAMDWLRINSSDNTSGSVHIDLLLPSKQFDRRFPASDESYTFSKDDIHSRIRHGKPIDLYHQSIVNLPKPNISNQQLKAIESLATSLEDSLLVNKPSIDVSKIKERFKKFNIHSEGGKVTGRHIFYIHTADIYRGLDVEGDIKRALDCHLREAGTLLLQLAYAWHALPSEHDERNEVANMAIQLCHLLLKSGWHQGHGQGTLHHFGYSAREYYTASFLLRNLLAEHQLRDPVAKALQWFNDAHYCFDDYASTHYADLDYFNTLATPQLQALLLTKHPGERHLAVSQWSKTLSMAISNNRHGNNGGFKEDGSAYHHWGHYPAYQTGALNSLSYIFKYLSPTPFRLSEKAYLSFRKSLLSTRIFSNLHSWPRSISGRHAYSQHGISSLQQAFVNFAQSGTLDGSLPIDPEIAAATLRLYPKAKSTLTKANPESSPNGHWSFPYAHLSAHRRDDWLAVARGHSRYVWASEIYGGVNRYGRYQSHGTLEILPLGGLKAAGVSEDGWDWSRPPGATVTRLPIDKLPFENVIMMPTTDETFVGTVHLNNQQGLFGMILQEKAERNRPEIGLHARKSYSFFDDMIVCLGSAIQSPGNDYNTETILFQQHLTTDNNPILINDQTVDNVPFACDRQTRTVLTDTIGNYFLIPRQQGLNITRQNQKSRFHYPTRKQNNQGATKNTNPITQGQYATAWIDHGKAPQNAKYQYVILVQANEERAQEWLKSPQFLIHQHDSNAHIVQHNNTITYTIFEPTQLDASTIVKSCSAPCLMITEATDDTLQINLSDPNLRMPGGEGGTLQGEIVVPTCDSSETANIDVFVHGSYELVHAEDATLILTSDEQTQIRFVTRRGRTQKCILKRSSTQANK